MTDRLTVCFCINSDTTPDTSVEALATSGTNIFAAVLGSGVFFSSNNGESWTEINAGLTNPYVQALAVSGTNIFAGTTGGGVFISDLFANTVASVSAASFSSTELATESIYAAFGSGLATATETASTLPHRADRPGAGERSGLSDPVRYRPAVPQLAHGGEHTDWRNGRAGALRRGARRLRRGRSNQRAPAAEFGRTRGSRRELAGGRKSGQHCQSQHSLAYSFTSPRVKRNAERADNSSASSWYNKYWVIDIRRCLIGKFYLPDMPAIRVYVAESDAQRL